MSRVPISVLLPTYNCANIVRNTLESIKWADEILVVDSYSTDKTLDICRGYGARIIQHEYVNSAKQKNWAVAQCQFDWVLQIDTDEVLEPGLKEEVELAVASAPPQVEAFLMPRKNHVLGCWMRSGGVYPDYQTRLFRRDAGRWVEREVHAHIQVMGAKQTLRHHILHYGMPHLSKQLRNLDRYTRYEADEAHKQGLSFRWHHLLIRPSLVFLHRYLWQQGFRNGWRGFIICAYLGMYAFWARAKLWELEALNLKKSPE